VKSRSRIQELEISLSRSQDEVKQLSYAKLQVEESSQQLHKELDASKRKISSLERFLVRIK
jgi:hypothetical protein